MLNFVFLSTSLSTTSLHQTIGTVFKSSNFVFKLCKQVETLTNLSISSLLTSTLKARKSFLAAKVDVSMPAACSNFI